MKSVWKLPICSGNERLKDENGNKIHSTQKPESLLERIILACSKENEIVMDIFSGTGTTCAVAKRLNRKFIGIERDEKYWKESLKRIEKVQIDDRVDLIKNVYDKKEIKVEFKELIINNLVKTTDIVTIDGFEYKLHFNNEGKIVFDNCLFTPNQLCKELFKKPTNAWDIIKVNNQKINKIREEFRKKINNS